MKSYQVELVTIQPITQGEDFWMYRGYISKCKALAVAKLLSYFIPYYRYPTQIIVNEYDVFVRKENGKKIYSLHNERVIKKYTLKDENNRVVKPIK